MNHRLKSALPSGLKSVCVNSFFAPLGLVHSHLHPTARVVGCILAPFRGHFLAARFPHAAGAWLKPFPPKTIYDRLEDAHCGHLIIGDRFAEPIRKIYSWVTLLSYA